MLRVLTAWYERSPGEFTVDWEWGELIDNAAAEALRNNASRRYNAMKAESAADRLYNEFRSLRIAARRNCGKDELNADPILLRTNNSEISKRRGQVTLNAALLASGADVVEGTGRPCDLGRWADSRR
ncbi:hypothetical protein [Streptomyces sp. NPDC002205]|uniref:hypothetical protein n=1 Tax=Streptomyces sp. NPDC002205 TaxID=3154411 RepID=UPI00331C3473